MRRPTGRGRRNRARTAADERRPAGSYRVRVPDPELLLTGERTLPGIAPENYWFRRHQAAYRYLGSRLTGDTLLEVGCGEGYGAAMLAGRFTRTVALDYDQATISHLHRHYPELTGCRANLAALPIGSGRVSALVSLQVLEHVWVPAEFLAECRRVLTPDGLLALSTPNRLTFSPGLARGQKPQNPFHVREFDADELVELVSGAGFEVVELLGLRAGDRLRRLEDECGGLVEAQLRTPAADWPASLAELISDITVADFAVSEGQIPTSLDLLVLARPA